MGTRRHEVAQRPVTDALVPLYDLDLSLYGGGSYHWTAGPMNSQSGNLVSNPYCLKNTTGWGFGGTSPPTNTGLAGAVGPTWTLRSFGSGYMHRSSGLAAGQYMDAFTSSMTGNFAASPAIPAGSWIEAQARVCPHRCSVALVIQFLDAAGGLLSSTAETVPTAVASNSGATAKANEVDDYTQVWVQAQAPANCKSAQLVLRARGIGGGAATTPYVFFSLAQIAQVYGASSRPLPVLPSSVVGLVSFGGVQYRPVPLQLTGVQTTGQGPIPRPKVTVPNIDNFARALMGTYRDLIRGKITRRRVFKRFLDGQPEADPTEYYGPDIWFIDRIANAGPDSVTFELASPLDIQGKKLPGRQVIRDVCTHTYRTWTPALGFKQGSCPYAGPNYFTVDGTPTGDPAADSCGRSFIDCGLRFPYPQSLPTRAFPGSVRARI